MDGVKLPGTFGQIHNGCLRVDDVCERCESTGPNEYHFELFVGTSAYSRKMELEMKNKSKMVTFTKKQCKAFNHKVSPSSVMFVE
jgi:hypothetical protein